MGFVSFRRYPCRAHLAPLFYVVASGRKSFHVSSGRQPAERALLFWQVIKSPSRSLWFKSERELVVARCGKRLGQFEKPFANGGFLNPVIGPDQFQRFAFGHRIAALVDFHIVIRTGRMVFGEILKEVGNRNIKYAAQVVETARADAVGAAFVFLDLLKGQPDGFAELFLAEAEQRPALANLSADVDINRMWFARNSGFNAYVFHNSVASVYSVDRGGSFLCNLFSPTYVVVF